MPAPIATPALCDVFGCGRLAVNCTDGSEQDEHPLPGASRKPIPHVNHCAHHPNWPFSEDARRFAASDVYRARTAQGK